MRATTQSKFLDCVVIFLMAVAVKLLEKVQDSANQHTKELKLSERDDSLRLVHKYRELIRQHVSEDEREATTFREAHKMSQMLKS